MNEQSRGRDQVVVLAEEAGLALADARIEIVAETLEAFRPFLASFAPIVADEDRPLPALGPGRRA